mmetsp:Transcript_85812/g.229583  ORF Transcript_85812/g.229583 Transcript_85812/m.229583 type:complete len:205 (-) Transcript_85812:1631-2245(-)
MGKDVLHLGPRSHSSRPKLRIQNHLDRLDILVDAGTRRQPLIQWRCRHKTNLVLCLPRHPSTIPTVLKHCNARGGHQYRLGQQHVRQSRSRTPGGCQARCFTLRLPTTRDEATRLRPMHWATAAAELPNCCTWIGKVMPLPDSGRLAQSGPCTANRVTLARGAGPGLLGNRRPGLVTPRTPCRATRADASFEARSLWLLAQSVI